MIPGSTCGAPENSSIHKSMENGGSGTGDPYLSTPPSSSHSATGTAQTFSRTPPSAHRWNQSWTVLLGPYLAGNLIPLAAGPHAEAALGRGIGPIQPPWAPPELPATPLVKISSPVGSDRPSRWRLEGSCSRRGLPGLGAAPTRDWRMNLLLSRLDEQQRRWYAAVESCQARARRGSVRLPAHRLARRHHPPGAGRTGGLNEDLWTVSNGWRGGGSRRRLEDVPPEPHGRVAQDDVIPEVSHDNLVCRRMGGTRIPTASIEWRPASM